MLVYQNISRYNPWHNDSEYRIDTSIYHRELFQTLVDTLSRQMSVSISGLRRTGKTTLMQQLINYLLDRGVKPKNILYYIFEENDTDLKQILDHFFSTHSKNDYYHQEFYIFLDELQYVKNWQNIIKIHYDLNNQIRFIISGSASVYLSRTVTESLAGRIIDYQLFPLTFCEYLNLKHQTNFDLLEFKGVLALMTTNEKMAQLRQLMASRSAYEAELGYYMRYGEFPKLVESSQDVVFNQKYLQNSILDKILSRDIQIFEVTKIQEVGSLYRSIVAATAQVFSVNKAAAELGIAYQSVTKYIEVLKLAYLIESIKNRLNSVRSQELAQEKVFSTSVNLVCLLLNIEDPRNPMYPAFKGHLIETFVYNHIKRIGPTYYYRHQEKEVDFVLEAANQTIPFEVKSTNTLKTSDLNHLWWYLDKKKLKEGWLLYGGEVKVVEREGKRVFCFPWWGV